MKRKKMKMKLMILMMVTLLLLLQCNDQPELADRVSVVPVLSICDALEHAATSLPHKHAKKTLRLDRKTPLPCCAAALLPPALLRRRSASLILARSGSSLLGVDHRLVISPSSTAAQAACAPARAALHLAHRPLLASFPAPVVRISARDGLDPLTASVSLESRRFRPYMRESCYRIARRSSGPYQISEVSLAWSFASNDTSLSTPACLLRAFPYSTSSLLVISSVTKRS
ncbi:uncharacterized protein PAN0_026c6158 [Moesziomyces antarcticus]|uniref:Uncharacterized protein n=1 Tax=Pseudozyma antarctica TaxID=84753 RepID=A0A081CMN2_PSEA2|nr:uncharacterized protein PAN0_026c6158 [Moesziomyces antarcticus]GAK67928.1 hypothetical protein PAN0_026c6158 [Moesziomyces antarcticus]